MGQWQLQEAKNRLSALVDAAVSGEPQKVTRRGKPAVVNIACGDYERLPMPARRFEPYCT